MRVWTDYPILEDPGTIAPIREVEVISMFPLSKYATVRFEGKLYNFKKGYLYTEPGRCGEVPAIPWEMEFHAEDAGASPTYC